MSAAAIDDVGEDEPYRVAPRAAWRAERGIRRGFAWLITLSCVVHAAALAIVPQRASLGPLEDVVRVSLTLAPQRAPEPAPTPPALTTPPRVAPSPSVPATRVPVAPSAPPVVAPSLPMRAIATAPTEPPPARISTPDRPTPVEPQVAPAPAPVSASVSAPVSASVSAPVSAPSAPIAPPAPVVVADAMPATTRAPGDGPRAATVGSLVAANVNASSTTDVSPGLRVANTDASVQVAAAQPSTQRSRAHSTVAYLERSEPEYPPIARRMGLEGTVILKVLVGASGAAEQVALLESSGAPILDAAAMRSVRAWKFVPAKRDEIAIAHWAEVPVRFRLTAAR